MKTQELNQNTFDSTISASSTPVLVDFWSEGCGPCKMLAPVLEELATEQAGEVVVAKVNIADEPELAMRFNITVVPTLIIFKRGQPVRTFKGVQSRRELLVALGAS